MIINTIENGLQLGNWNKTRTPSIAYFLGINGDCLFFSHPSKESDIYTTAMNCPIPAIFGTKQELDISSFIHVYFLMVLEKVDHHNDIYMSSNRYQEKINNDP